MELCINQPCHDGDHIIFQSTTLIWVLLWFPNVVNVSKLWNRAKCITHHHINKDQHQYY